MAGSKRLIIGLGNPGEEYTGTRHNVGFDVIDLLSERLNIALKQKGEMMLGWGSWKGRRLGLLKPLTFMNRSGMAVEKAMRDNSIRAEDLFIISDDINLPIGKTRIRSSGSGGGHNGLEDVIDWLDDDSFPRLRIGIGRDFGRGQQATYVLAPIPEHERQVMGEAVKTAGDAALCFVQEGVVTAMNRYN